MSLKILAVRAWNPPARQYSQYGLNWADSALLPSCWIPCPYSKNFKKYRFVISYVNSLLNPILVLLIVIAILFKILSGHCGFLKMIF